METVIPPIDSNVPIAQAPKWPTRKDPSINACPTRKTNKPKLIAFRTEAMDVESGSSEMNLGVEVVSFPWL